MKYVIDILDDAYKYCVGIKDEDIRDLGFFTSHILKSVANGIPFDSFLEREEDTEYKNLLIKLENAEDVIRGLKEDLQDAREELREISLYAMGST